MPTSCMTLIDEGTHHRRFGIGREHLEATVAEVAKQTLGHLTWPSCACTKRARDVLRSNAANQFQPTPTSCSCTEPITAINSSAIPMNSASTFRISKLNALASGPWLVGRHERAPSFGCNLNGIPGAAERRCELRSRSLMLFTAMPKQSALA